MDQPHSEIIVNGENLGFVVIQVRQRIRIELFQEIVMAEGS